MLSACTLSKGNNCLTSFLFNVVTLLLAKMAIAGNSYHLRLNCDIQTQPTLGVVSLSTVWRSTQMHPALRRKASQSSLEHGVCSSYNLFLYIINNLEKTCLLCAPSSNAMKVRKRVDEAVLYSGRTKCEEGISTAF